MKNVSGKFKFTIPEGHERAGEFITKPFDYEVCETAEEVEAVIEKEEWNIVKIVNNLLKTNARANAYQRETAAYKPVENPEAVQERMIRDGIRMGLSEEQSRAMVESMLSSVSQSS